MSAFCVSLRHQRAAEDLRGRLAIPASALPRAFVRLKTMPRLSRGLDRLDFDATAEASAMNDLLLTLK
jgi:hypothetical protein